MDLAPPSDLLYGAAGPQWQLTMAASTVIMLPCLILSLLTRRSFVRGIILTRLKGQGVGNAKL